MEYTLRFGSKVFIMRDNDYCLSRFTVQLREESVNRLGGLRIEVVHLNEPDRALDELRPAFAGQAHVRECSRPLPAAD